MFQKRSRTYLSTVLFGLLASPLVAEDVRYVVPDVTYEAIYPQSPTATANRLASHELDLGLTEQAASEGPGTAAQTVSVYAEEAAPSSQYGVRSPRTTGSWSP